eukprot:TRINITY_DN134_c0_g1_i1.p2 TRINITY_DN134_c0_g1~~TRINITY_DN134_c0_g1_i1.p2  ORF type:complete len:118 (-),score=55.36 TRINITY_DN134_c0_g1_i1:145-498(-)
MIRRPPRSTLSSSSAASDVYKRQVSTQSTGLHSSDMSSVTEILNGLKSQITPAMVKKTKTVFVFDIGGKVFTLDLSLIHISEPTRLLSISYAVFCLKKKKKKKKKKNSGLKPVFYKN